MKWERDWERKTGRTEGKSNKIKKWRKETDREKEVIDKHKNIIKHERKIRINNNKIIEIDYLKLIESRKQKKDEPEDKVKVKKK